MTSKLESLQSWVDQVAAHTQPEAIHWCNGSEEEYRDLIEQMLATGTLTTLNKETHPNCYLHLSSPNDVARVEHLTFVCTPEEEDAGPNNHWMPPADGHKQMDALFDGCMKGRVMYVIPYCMGPLDSPYARCGVEITDSPYVVVNMKLMTRMGSKALERIENEGKFVRGLHSTGELDPDRRFIMHFPEELSIKSYGSGYGGNALLGKKCHALRIASYQARQEGWLAEHMLIVGLENPDGAVHYVACAFPSACGKTNLAMLIPPESMKGWRVWTVGDDIAWLHLDEGGKLRAVNPESGYFGVVPGTNEKTNKNAYDMITHDAIFTNVATTEDKQPWWEGKKDGTPARDWQGRSYDETAGPAAHPNSRSIIFGGRRKQVAPLVYQAKNWEHGVLIGASTASETTAAMVGDVGVVRRDPMAMKPFCGYNFADYWAHWLSFPERSEHLPKMFHVNWFRQNEDGDFLWPGFGENLRVLEWIIERCEGRADAEETAIGYLPHVSDINTSELDIQPETLDELLTVDTEQWRAEMASVIEYLESYGERLPKELKKQQKIIADALDESLAKAS
jgi:phosphoenolpyruvate carboxykinase (GTP)